MKYITDIITALKQFWELPVGRQLSSVFIIIIFLFYLNNRSQSTMIADLRTDQVKREREHRIEIIAYIKACDSLAEIKADQERERERIQAKERIDENNKIMDAALNKMDNLIKGQELSKQKARKTLSTIKKQ